MTASTSTEADRDREQRRARHAQRVSALRAQRQHQPRESAYAAVDPFALVGAQPYEEVFSP